jgi:hypothetical protein
MIYRNTHIDETREGVIGGIFTTFHFYILGFFANPNGHAKL